MHVALVRRTPPRRLSLALLLSVSLVTALAGTVSAAPSTTDTATLSAQVNIAAKAKLSLDTARLTFPDADPSGGAVPADQAVNVSASARTSAKGAVTLTVKAGSDLLSGSDTIPASAISWRSASPGFLSAGTIDTVDQTVANWTGSGQHNGTLTFSFANGWQYPVGTYNANLIFTLSSP